MVALLTALPNALEKVGASKVLGRALATVWGATMGRSVVRSLPVPERVRVVTVGGATLGGSGKTPVSIACAQELARAGLRTVLVGHAYRANPGRARVVSVGDPLAEVGDEALVAAAALRPFGARVVVAPRRRDALAYAAQDADVLVIDGVLQLSPQRASLAILSVDAAEPWGQNAAYPPLGDLRAAPAILLDACDAVVPIEADGDAVSGLEIAKPGGTFWSARAVSRGAWTSCGSLVTWESLRSVRIGLLTSLARPERLLRALAHNGIKPYTWVAGRDHGPIPTYGGKWKDREFEKTGEFHRRGGELANEKANGSKHNGIDLWIATAKCAEHVRGKTLTAPLATLDYSVVLHPRLCARLHACALP